MNASFLDGFGSVTPGGRAGFAALARQPRDALIALDFDGTLAPIVPDPRAARPVPGVIEVLARLVGRIGTLAVITGRSAPDAVVLGGLDEIPGVGPTRRRELLKFFGTVDKMKRVTAEDLAKAPGMNKSVAQAVFDHLRGA